MTTLGYSAPTVRAIGQKCEKPHDTLVKVFVTIGAVFLSGCASINQPTCSLPLNVDPKPPAHVKPYQPAPWVSFDGTRFPYSKWGSSSPSHPKAVVILAPGWDGTMTDYSVLGKHLAAHHYLVYGSEQRTGVYDPENARRGNPTNWHDWVRDLQAFTTFVARQHPDLTIFYHGHSFGTVVVLQAAAENSENVPIQGIILQSAAMPFLIEKESALKRALMSIFSEWRVPHLLLLSPLNLEPTGSKVENCQWSWSSDRLREGYKVRYFLQATGLGHQARLASINLTLQVLALEGQKDNVVAPSPEDKVAYDHYLHHVLAGGKARVIRYRDGYHTMTIVPTGDLALDASSSKALRDITRWLDQQPKR